MNKDILKDLGKVLKYIFSKGFKGLCIGMGMASLIGVVKHGLKYFNGKSIDDFIKTRD